MFGLKKLCALLCACLGLCSSNIKAADKIENLQKRSALTGFNVELDEFISEELERTKIEGSKKSQFGAETFFGNGTLPLKRKEAIRARGAQSVLRNDEVLRAYFAQDSGKLREMSKNEGRLSNGLYALSWPSILLALGIPIHDAIKGIRMQLIYCKFCNEFEKLEKIKIQNKESKTIEITEFQKFLQEIDEKHLYYYNDEKYWGNYCNMVWGNLLHIALGNDEAGEKNGERLTWEQYKNKVAEKSQDWKTKFTDPVDSWVHLLRSFRTSETTKGGYVNLRIVAESVVLKDLVYVFPGGLASTTLNSVLNNLSQREQGKSDELNVLADKVDQLKKMKGDKKSFVKKHLKLKAQAESSNIVKKFPNTLKKS